MEKKTWSALHVSVAGQKLPELSALTVKEKVKPGLAWNAKPVMEQQELRKKKNAKPAMVLEKWIVLTVKEKIRTLKNVKNVKGKEKFNNK